MQYEIYEIRVVKNSADVGPVFRGINPLNISPILATSALPNDTAKIIIFEKIVVRHVEREFFELDRIRAYLTNRAFQKLQSFTQILVENKLEITRVFQFWSLTCWVTLRRIILACP